MTLDYRNPMNVTPQPSRRGKIFVFCLAGAFFGLLLLGVLFPSTGRAREAANRVKCASNLRQIAQAAFLYANDNQGQFPPDLVTILQTQDVTSEVFICASSAIDRAKGATTQQVVAEMLAGDHISYAWAGGGLMMTLSADVVLSFDIERHAARDSAPTAGFNVLLGDGSVTFVNDATGKAIWAQFVSGVRPIRLSTAATPATTSPASQP